MSNIHLITYATHEYMPYARQLVRTASRYFNTATCHTPQDISAEYKEHNKQFFSNKHGGGLWVWKPYIIRKALYSIPHGDILVYSDSTFRVHGDLAGLIKSYFANAPDQCVVAFREHHYVPNNRYREVEWSKSDAFKIIGVNDVSNDPEQAWAGFLAIRKCEMSCNVIDTWFVYCQDRRVVDSNPSTLSEEDGRFKENRHDQTALSLVLRKYGIVPILFPNANDIISVVWTLHRTLEMYSHVCTIMDSQDHYNTAFYESLFCRLKRGGKPVKMLIRGLEVHARCGSHVDGWKQYFKDVTIDVDATCVTTYDIIFDNVYPMSFPSMINHLNSDGFYICESFNELGRQVIQEDKWESTYLNHCIKAFTLAHAKDIPGRNLLVIHSANADPSS